MTKQTTESCRAKGKVLNSTTARCNKIIKANSTRKLSILRKQCLEKKKVYDTRTKKCVNTAKTCKAKGKVYNNKTKRCNKSKPVIEIEQCPICTEVLTRKGVIVTKCKHKFHIDCLGVWCRNNNNSTSCPMCRAPINDTCLAIKQAKRENMNRNKKIKVFQHDIYIYRKDRSHLPDNKEWVLQDDVTNLSYLFKSVKQPNDFFKTIGVPKWNVSNVTNMYSMFNNTESFNQPLEKWNVSNVTNMSGMFNHTESFNQPLEKWNVSNVTDMHDMFSEAEAFNQPLEKWNVSNVTDMSFMFFGTKVFNQPLEKWNVSNVTDMSDMFYGAKAFNQPLEKWNVSNVEFFTGMFDNADAFNQSKPRFYG